MKLNGIEHKCSNCGVDYEYVPGGSYYTHSPMECIINLKKLMDEEREKNKRLHSDHLHCLNDHYSKSDYQALESQLEVAREFMKQMRCIPSEDDWILNRAQDALSQLTQAEKGE